MYRPSARVMPTAAQMERTPQQHVAMPQLPVYDKAAKDANTLGAYPAPLPAMVTMPSYENLGETEAAAYMAAQAAPVAAAPTPVALPQEQRPDTNGWRWNPQTYSWYRIDDAPMS